MRNDAHRWRLCSLLLVLAALAPSTTQAKIVDTSAAGFTVTHELVLPVTPEAAYDAMTGDISGWWDHSFSESPAALYIEPRPGGGFYEIFDETGDGALHATVTCAHRGKMLRYVGPLGLAGNPLELVMTFVFETEGDGTRISLTVVAMGIMQDGWDRAVDGVWHHFLFDRLKPYVESGRHLEKTHD